MSHIKDGIYIGSVKDANNINFINEKSITHVLCVASEVQPAFHNGVVYKHLKLSDHPLFSIFGYLSEASNFIKSGKEDGGNILVHCRAGISRSSSCVIAYLIEKDNMTLQDSIKLCKKKRPIICPNPGFMQQLRAFERGSRWNSSKEYLKTLGSRTRFGRLHQLQINKSSKKKAKPIEQLEASELAKTKLSQQVSPDKKSKEIIMTTTSMPIKAVRSLEFNPINKNVARRRHPDSLLIKTSRDKLRGASHQSKHRQGISRDVGKTRLYLTCSFKPQFSIVDVTSSDAKRGNICARERFQCRQKRKRLSNLTQFNLS